MRIRTISWSKLASTGDSFLKSDFVFSICLVVNFTVLGWGMGFPCYGRQAGDFFKASNPLGPSLLQQLVPLFYCIS